MTSRNRLAPPVRLLVGYVYFTYYLQDAYFLSRINVENGNVDEPYTDSAFYCAIKDGISLL